MGNIRAALDIGSSKVACIIFEASSAGELLGVLGTSTKASTGVRCGIVGGSSSNQTAAASAISAAIYEAEKQAGLTVKKAIVNCSHPASLSTVLSTKVNLKGRQVSPKDIKDITGKILHKETIPNYLTVHSFQLCYDVDSQHGVQNPEYMFANELSAYSSVVAFPKNYLTSLEKCIRKLHLIPEYFVASAYASSLSMDLGALKDFILVDIGAETSDIMVFDHNSTPIWTGSVPLGGNNITKDIASCFGISYEKAERLKVLNGLLTGRPSEDGDASNDWASSTEGGSMIPPVMLNKIVKARVEETIEMILNKIPTDYRLNKMMLTGGAAKLAGIAEFVSDMFNCQAEILFHEGINYPGSRIKDDPSFSTSLGLIKYYLMEQRKKPSLSFKKIFHWMWDSF